MEFEISVKPEVLANFGSFSLTNTLLISWFIVLGLIFFSWLITKKQHLTRTSKLQIITESVLEFLLNLIDSITQDRKLTLKVFPLIATIFIFVLFSNWIELLPGLGTIKLKTSEGEVPLIRSSSADLNTTLALALISFFFIQFWGIKSLKLNYLKKFFSIKNPISFFVGILELISEFTKIISFSFRLFGNIFAGEVLLLVTLILIPFLVPIPFLVLEIFVGLIQAFIFSIITLIFIKVATLKHEH